LPPNTSFERTGLDRFVSLRSVAMRSAAQLNFRWTAQIEIVKES